MPGNANTRKIDEVENRKFMNCRTSGQKTPLGVICY